jgi:hypothetical protein
MSTVVWVTISDSIVRDRGFFFKFCSGQSCKQCSTTVLQFYIASVSSPKSVGKEKQEISLNIQKNYFYLTRKKHNINIMCC